MVRVGFLIVNVTLTFLWLLLLYHGLDAQAHITSRSSLEAVGTYPVRTQHLLTCSHCASFPPSYLLTFASAAARGLSGRAGAGSCLLAVLLHRTAVLGAPCQLPRPHLLIAQELCPRPQAALQAARLQLCIPVCTF